MPLPDPLDAFTLRAGFATAITDPLDYSSGGPAGLLGAGLTDPKTGLGGELTLVVYPGKVREVPYPFLAGELTVALAYDLANGQRVDVPLRICAGARTLFINDRKVLSCYKLEKQLRLEAETSDTTALAARAGACTSPGACTCGWTSTTPPTSATCLVGPRGP